MSYDVYINCTRCGSGVVDANYTRNMSWMWRREGCDLTEFDGKKAIELLPSLQHAIDAIQEELDTYGENAYTYYPETKDLLPTNGWGDVPSALEFLKKIRDGAAREPEGIVKVSW